MQTFQQTSMLLPMPFPKSQGFGTEVFHWHKRIPMKKTGEQSHNYFYITKQRVRQQEIENGGKVWMHREKERKEGRWERWTEKRQFNNGNCLRYIVLNSVSFFLTSFYVKFTHKQNFVCL